MSRLVDYFAFQNEMNCDGAHISVSPIHQMGSVIEMNCNID